MFKRVLLAFLGLASLQTLGRAQTSSETLLAFGAGTLGSWATEYAIANSTSTPMSVYLGNTAEHPQACPPLIGCSQYAITIPVSPNGTARSFGPAFGFGTMHLQAMDNPAAPSVRARIINTANPSQSIELPVFRLSTLLALNPSRLAFPGATKSASTHSNLILAVLRPSGDFSPRSASATIEAYSNSGLLLGSRALFLECCQPLFLMDVVAFLGIDSLEQGQIRVSKSSGNGVLWGIMPSLNSNGTIAVSLGANP